MLKSIVRLSRPALLLAAALLIPATPARADLIDLQNGMIYDSIQNLTWMQDAMFSRTVGDDDDGLMQFAEATSWAASLEFGGFNDWRLPKMLVQPGYRTELAQLFQQLDWRADESTQWDWVNAGGHGPFVNIDSQSGRIWSYWIEDARITNAIFTFDIPDRGLDSYQGVWVVRDGAPHARVPEPTTLLFMAIGAAGLIARRNHNRRANTGN